jgi:putative membrane protein
MSLLVHWVVLAVALWVAANVVPGVQIALWQPLLLGAAVLGVVNAVVRPVMTILTLPITILTLGLFYLVVNGAAFGLAAALVPGFDVASWLAAILGALVTGLAAWLVGTVLAPATHKA